MQGCELVLFRYTCLSKDLREDIFLFLLVYSGFVVFFFFSSRRRHTRSKRDWSSDVCSSDLRPRRTVGRGVGPLPSKRRGMAADAHPEHAARACHAPRRRRLAVADPAVARPFAALRFPRRVNVGDRKSVV